MKNDKFYHCIMFNYQGMTYQVDLYAPYRLTYSAMAKRFFQAVIDDGYSIGEITDVEFLIGGEHVLGCSSANFLRRFFFPLGREVKTIHGENGAKAP